jgi:hypothetical protein
MYVRVVARFNKELAHPGRGRGAASALHQRSQHPGQGHAQANGAGGASTAALIERLATNEEHRVVGKAEGQGSQGVLRRLTLDGCAGTPGRPACWRDLALLTDRVRRPNHTMLEELTNLVLSCVNSRLAS